MCVPQERSLIREVFILLYLFYVGIVNLILE